MPKQSAKPTVDLAELQAVHEALDRVQGIAEFDLDGTVLRANENFLAIFGYALDEVAGKHHRTFCDPEYAKSAEYAELWRKLGQGEFLAGEFKRVAQGGKDIYLQASYNPVLDGDGKPIRIVRFATDITGAKLQQPRQATLSAGDPRCSP